MPALSFSTKLTSLSLNKHTFTSFIDGDFIELNYLNDATYQVRSQDSVNIGERSDAKVAELVLRVLQYSSDDIFLNTQLNKPGAAIFKGSLTRNYISDQGVDGLEVYNLESGSLTAPIAIKYNNQEGNDVMMYTFKFNKTVRTV
jgi:hypothetical protein